jgi:hypothetical protein
MFGWFKKKKDEDENKYLDDPSNFRLNKMRKNGFVDYDLQTWQVQGIYEYDWGNNFFADEFLLTAGNDSFYLYIEEDGELDCTISRKISINEIINATDIDTDLIDYLIDKETAPRKIHFQSETYFKEGGEQIGYFHAIEEKDWSEFVSWMFWNKEKTKFINITQWGEEEFDAVGGVPVKEYEFSNFIMP